jgi:hypothetical protein
MVFMKERRMIEASSMWGLKRLRMGKRWAWCLLEDAPHQVQVIHPYLI